VIDVGRDDGAATRDLVAHELGSDLSGNVGAERFAAVLVEEVVWRIGVPPVWPPGILPGHGEC